MPFRHLKGTMRGLSRGAKLALAATTILLASASFWARGCRVDHLDRVAEQLRGGHCLYEAEYRDFERGVERYRCRPVNYPGLRWLMVDHANARCKIDAARCLQEEGPGGTSAVPALIDALHREEDAVNTGDGLLELRASIAQALGLIGDVRAIEPLVETLLHSKDVARAAAARALGQLGPAAHDAAKALSEPLTSESTVALCERECARGRLDCARVEAAAADSLMRVAPDEACTLFSAIVENPRRYPHLTDAVAAAQKSFAGVCERGPRATPP